MHITKIALAVGVLLVAAACKPATPKPDASPPPPAAPSLVTVGAAAAPPEDFDAAAKLPTGQANLRICLPAYLDKEDWAPVTLPAGVIFESAGRKKGDERAPGIDSDAWKEGAIKYAVVLAKPVTLSKTAPCAATTAQTARSDLFGWSWPLVRRSQDLQFKAVGIESQMTAPGKDRVSDMIQKGQVYAYPSGDIGHQRALKEG